MFFTGLLAHHWETVRDDHKAEDVGGGVILEGSGKTELCSFSHTSFPSPWPALSSVAWQAGLAPNTWFASVLAASHADGK